MHEPYSHPRVDMLIVGGRKQGGSRYLHRSPESLRLSGSEIANRNPARNELPTQYHRPSGNDVRHRTKLAHTEQDPTSTMASSKRSTIRSLLIAHAIQFVPRTAASGGRRHKRRNKRRYSTGKSAVLRRRSYPTSPKPRTASTAHTSNRNLDKTIPANNKCQKKHVRSL